MRFIAKRWQEIIDGTPTFWKFVAPALPPHVHEATIRRSGTSSLVIVYPTNPHRRITDTGPSIYDFLNRLAHTSSRWSAYYGPMVPEYFDKPAPRLQTIILTRRAGPATALELLGGKTEHLRHVDLSFLAIQWRMGLFTQLIFLRLNSVNSFGFTTAHLVDTLRASPCLEHLHLARMNRTTDDPPPLQVITLPGLQSINVNGCVASFTADILRYIRAPSAIRFCLSVVWDASRGDLEAFLDEDLQHFQEFFRAAHRRNGSSTLSLDYDVVKWASPGGEGSQDDLSFSVSIQCSHWTPCIRWPESILLEDPGLNVRFGSLGNVGHQAFEVLAPMRCVTRAESVYTFRVDEFVSVLEFIGKPLSGDPSLPSLPCLQKLVIRDIKGNARNLLDMVHSRFNSVSWKGGKRTPLTINFGRPYHHADDCARSILDLTTLMNIRETVGVERVGFVGSEQLDGTLAVICDEEVPE
ncbi:hypothetical protein FRC01_009751 [Tulasnella sp. 417]|nr:hypothetical protein FRC01_009751 [Tulasnella sp. 417]